MRVKNYKLSDMCTVSVLCALGVVLSSFLQIPIFSDIRIDLSYIVIVYICYRYGGSTGGLSAGIIAGVESALFTSYGFSLSWTCANVFIGIIVGVVMSFNQIKSSWIKHMINATAIIISIAVGMIVIKSFIEIKLFSLTWAIKLLKNAVAFACDTFVMLIGYFSVLPILKKIEAMKEGKDSDNNI